MRIWPIIMLCCGVLAGCRKEEPLPMPRNTFVQVMVELRQAATPPADPQAFAVKRAEILKRHGVTEAQLREYARKAARHPGELADTYDTISARLRQTNVP